MAMATMFPLAVGPGTPHDTNEKFKLLKLTAGRDHGRSTARSWLILGRVHLAGQGTRVDPREALHCFEQASERGEPYGALEAGNLLFSGGPGFRANRRKAQELYQAAAAHGGVPEAQRKLGELFLTGPPGQGPGQGHAQALKYFQRAFAIDPIVNASAGMSAARMLQCGLGCDGGLANPKEALVLLEEAASVGSLGSARMRLAVMYDLGCCGAKKDALKARSYWKLAVLSDVGEAHYRCGVLALHGAGFVLSERAAVNGFRRACKLGFPLAAQRLTSFRGAEAAAEVSARRVKQPDFIDQHFQAVLYPWPFYEDEVEQWRSEEAVRAENEAAASSAAKKAKIDAMLNGRSARANAREKGGADDQHEGGNAWNLPEVLRRHMEQERSDLMSCIDAFEQHLPGHYAQAPPPPPDRVRDFFKASGLSGLKLANVSVHTAVVALNKEGAEGPAFERGIDGYRNAVEDEQRLAKRLGVQRRTAKPLSTRPKSKGHPNLTGFEGKLYSEKASPDRRFVSAAAAEQAKLGEAKRRAVALDARRTQHLHAIAAIARGADSGGRSPSGTTAGRRGLAGSRQSGSTHHSSRPKIQSVSRREGGGAGGVGDEPPAWMYDKVWMERPMTDQSLVRAVELRTNYGVRLGSRAQNRRGP